MIKYGVDCLWCGWCCGYRRDSEFGGCEYAEDEPIPPDVKTDGLTVLVDEEDTCIYLEKLDNGFTRCTIQDKKPIQCRLFNCLTRQKIRNLKPIIEHLEREAEIGDSYHNTTQLHRD